MNQIFMPKIQLRPQSLCFNNRMTGVTEMSSFNVSSATTAELVEFFNANTGGNPVKKFADRKTAERRVNLLIAEMKEESPVGEIVNVTEAHHAETHITRSAMAESLKLDRRIICLTTGESYANACRVWKAGLVSAAQGDRLSALLYGAAKQGNRELVASVNGHRFTLEVK